MPLRGQAVGVGQNIVAPLRGYVSVVVVFLLQMFSHSVAIVGLAKFRFCYLLAFFYSIGFHFPFSKNTL